MHPLSSSGSTGTWGKWGHFSSMAPLAPPLSLWWDRLEPPSLLLYPTAPLNTRMIPHVLAYNNYKLVGTLHRTEHL